VIDALQWFRRFKRNPDAKWKLKPEFIDNIRKVQSEVLESYSKIVKPGGKWLCYLLDITF
jgi:16S rRNA C967 or C1407 C5-methylase (RsmB/RsmF family)